AGSNAQKVVALALLFRREIALQALLAFFTQSRGPRSLNLVWRRGYDPSGALVIHHGAGLPAFLVTFFVVGKVRLGFQVLLVVFRKHLNAFLVQLSVEPVFLVAVWLNSIGRYQKLLTAQPPAGINHNVANVAGGMIENHVVNFAEFFVIDPVNFGSANVFCIFKLCFAQDAVVRHVNSFVRSMESPVFDGFDARECRHAALNHQHAMEVCELFAWSNRWKHVAWNSAELFPSCSRNI